MSTRAPWQAFQGADGWYVAYVQPDGTHKQPALSRGMTEGEARSEARKRNAIMRDEDGR